MIDLNIAGVVPLSTIDWPDHLCATVFLQGCPWKCGYCQNQELLDPRIEGEVSWEEVSALLDRRRGLLDGVVFSGGEATRQDGLGAAIADVRARGFQVGLHTAGAYPNKLARVIGDVNWVGLDIKAMPEHYREVVGYDMGGKGWQCLDIVLAEAEQRENFSYEVRTTVHPDSMAGRFLPDIVAELRARGVQTFALQEARELGTSAEFRKQAHSWDLERWQDEWAQMVELVENAGFSKVYIRAAQGA
ncbi:MAG: anaerobic ribonucleoside-triphosphate reductase activating protein [Actinomycetaceae bacterium]|nr:anaerobic ribonucleoside-triphosphate reductase activating protein [Actinomycetaceae bacterium]